MPRKINPKWPLDDVEGEVMFTWAGVEADPDAKVFLSRLETWLPMVDAVRATERQARQTVMGTDARRQVRNVRLDGACIAFSDDLLRAVGKDRQSPRWKMFFSASPSRWVRQALSKQVDTVVGWLSTALEDSVLEAHRATLQRWSDACRDSLTETRATALVRGQVLVAREQLAEELTQERDGLHEALSALGRELGLDRNWADGFFRTESRRSNDTSSEEDGAPTT